MRAPLPPVISSSRRVVLFVTNDNVMRAQSQKLLALGAERVTAMAVAPWSRAI